MKLNLCLIGVFLFLISCSTTAPRYKQLTNNYELIDRIVKNPDSLYFWIKDSNYVCKYYLSYYSAYYTEHIFSKDINVIINKINDNYFKDGYSYYEDDVRLSTYKCFLEHWLWIESNKTGKKLFIHLNNDEGTWKIYWVGTYSGTGFDYID
jgi:hypothetical protein